MHQPSQVVLVIKNQPTNTGDIRETGSTPGSGRSLGGDSGNLLQYSCLENPVAENPDGLQSIGLQRAGHDWNGLAYRHAFISINSDYHFYLRSPECVHFITDNTIWWISPLFPFTSILWFLSCFSLLLWVWLAFLKIPFIHEERTAGLA